jgi:site-specific recombinase XerC
MNEIAIADRAADWRRLKALVLDSVSSPITKRVYHLGLNEFFAWYGQEARPGFTKATVSAWRVALEARGLGSVSINVRITAVRKLAVEAADNGLLAPELAAGITARQGRQVDRGQDRQLALRAASPEAPERAGRNDQEGTA